MGENIRLISDMMENTKAQNLSGILLSLDFKKAFDTLEWPYINKMLDTLLKDGLAFFMQILKQQF